MASFQALRQFLEQHRDELARPLLSDEQNAFRATLDQLQQDWQQTIDEQQKLDMTLREMQKYPYVWQRLETAHLVPLEESMRTASKLTHAVATPANTSRAGSGKRTDADDPTATPPKQPSQQVVDQLATWDKRAAVGRELMTNVLGALIVLVTLGIAIATIFSVSNPSTYAAAKDVLLFMNGLVGVVLGYYFGRIPGEVRADKAESEAKTANRERDQVIATVRTTLRPTLENSGGSSLSRAGAGSSGRVTLTEEQVESLRRLLYRYDE